MKINDFNKKNVITICVSSIIFLFNLILLKINQTIKLTMKLKFNFFIYVIF